MELWDVYDREGNLKGRTTPRVDRLAPGDYHLGVSLWIVNHRGEVLIQRRSDTKRIGPGLWSITGGAALAGETSAQGCLREVWEELGISLSEDDLAFFARTCGEDIIFDDFILVRDIPLDSLTLQEAEVAEARYVPIEEARELFRAGVFMLSGIEEFDRVEQYLNRLHI